MRQVCALLVVLVLSLPCLGFADGSLDTAQSCGSALSAQNQQQTTPLFASLDTNWIQNYSQTNTPIQLQATSPTTIEDGKRGCCSWHGGVAYCGSDGYWVCNDGTRSPTCRCD